MSPGLAAARRIAGNAALVVALLCIATSAAAAIRTKVTGRFSSGLYFVPTFCAIFGLIAGSWSWKLFAAVVFLDIGGLLIVSKVGPRR